MGRRRRNKGRDKKNRRGEDKRVDLEELNVGKKNEKKRKKDSRGERVRFFFSSATLCSDILACLQLLSL